MKEENLKLYEIISSSAGLLNFPRIIYLNKISVKELA
jgi:hypothetical protein